MDAETVKAVIADFETWSGGFPPDSSQEIFVYVEYARDLRLDPNEVTKVLRDWMAEEWIEADAPTMNWAEPPPPMRDRSPRECDHCIPWPIPSTSLGQ
jgi:hypothetical protein